MKLNKTIKVYGNIDKNYKWRFTTNPENAIKCFIIEFDKGIDDKEVEKLINEFNSINYDDLIESFLQGDIFTKEY